MRSVRSILVLGGALVGLAQPAGAALVTWVFGGTVGFFLDSHGVLDGSVGTGTPFDASITYAHVGSYTIAVPMMRIIVYDDYVYMAEPAYDQIDFNTSAPFSFPGVSGAQIDQADIGLLGADTGALSSDAPPASPPALAGFEASSRFFSLLGCIDTETSSGYCNTDSIEISAHLTSLPEPAEDSTGGLAAVALAGLAARRRSRSRER